MHATPPDVLQVVRAHHMFDGERSLGPGTLLIDGGKIVDMDTTGATPPGGRAR